MNDQLDLFSFSTPEYKIKKPIRLIEMFAGIGAQAKSLERLGAQFEHWRAYEIDQHAINSYNAIHGTDFAPQDITQTHASDLGITDRESYTYILTYSFPCQDLSLAGKGRGLDKGSGTRSGLLWEVERILDECQGNLPDVLLMENVPQIIGTKHIHNFQLWRRKLEQLGYSNFVQVLNSKHYGIPQNRARCFMVSILGDYHYTFPPKIPLEKKLKDMLEKNVDERYYLSERALNGIMNTTYWQTTWDARKPKDGIVPTLAARDYKDPKLVADRGIILDGKGGGWIEKGTGKHQSNELYSMDGLCPTLPASSGVKEPPKMFIEKIGNYSPSGYSSSVIVSTDGLAPTVMEHHGSVTAIAEGGVAIKNNNSKGYAIAHPGDGIDISSRMQHHRGTVQKEMSQTLDTQCNVGVIDEHPIGGGTEEQ